MQENFTNLFKKTRNSIVAIAKGGFVEHDQEFDAKEKIIADISSKSQNLHELLTRFSKTLETYAVLMTKTFSSTNQAVQGTSSEELAQQIQPQIAETGKTFLVAKYKIEKLLPPLIAINEESKVVQKLASAVRQNFVLLKTSEESIEKAKKKGEPSPKLIQNNEATKADFERAEAEFDTKYNEFTQKASETFQKTMKAQQYYLILLSKAQYTFFVSNLSSFPMNELESDFGNLDTAQLQAIIAEKKAEEEAREKEKFINKLPSINIPIPNILKKEEKKETPNETPNEANDQL